MENLLEARESIRQYLSAGDPLPAPPPAYRRWLAEVALELIEAELKRNPSHEDQSDSATH